MSEFTESQLQELETIFNLKRVESLPVKDGRVSAAQYVWWHYKEYPQHILARTHWDNIKEYPGLYSINKPKYAIQYID